jgi:hypothetical protein
MKRISKSLFAVLLAIAMLFSTVASNEAVYAVSEVLSTEDIDGTEESTSNAEVTFVNVANGNYITVSGVENDPILVDKKFTTSDDVTRNGIFTTYYGTYTNNGIDNKTNEVVNFVTSSRNTIWKADDSDIVYQKKVDDEGTIKSPTGWESVRIQHNADGTISLGSSADEKLFTLGTYTDDNNEKHTKLAVSSKYHLGDSNITDSEKFIIYTDNKPKKARKVTLSNIAGDSVDISWTAPTEQMYSSFEVLYSTSENGTYKSAGTTNKTKFTVSHLSAEKTYYFKIRTLTNAKGGAYADSAVAYATTLSLSKPAQAEITGIERDEKTGAQTITWNKAANAKSYNIYRAEGRFADYKLITTVSSENTSYTDTNPNSSSKYKNYYKVQSVNGNVNGEMSDPYSIEIDTFGYDTYIFNDTDNTDEISSKINEIFEYQHYDQFGTNRYSFAFKQGDYTDMEDDCYNIGYYTQIIGLGKTPYDVRLKNVKTPAALANGNVTCNFWVDIENLTIAQTSENADYWNDSFKWAVSQAAPARRLNIERQTLLQWTWGDNAWASGGYIADTIFQDAVGSWCQQQYYYRNCEFTTKDTSSGAIYGVNWNQVVQGCKNVDGSALKDNSGYYFNEAGSLLQDNGYTNWGQNGCTTVLNKTDETREKPFLYFDQDTDSYNVFVPSVRKDTTGVSWSKTNMGEGVSLSLDSFYVANPDTDTADSLNEALGKGYNLLLQPGVYKLDKALEITHENTIVLGLGMATFTSTSKNTDTFIRVAGKKWNSDYTKVEGNYDIGGVEIAGIILDAGEKTDTLLEVGYEGANVDHSDNPCVLQDVICRVGGTGTLGTTGSCIVVNSNNTIIDQTWIWRADHGDNTGWYQNTADNGLVVNGDYVQCYGLFVEHFQKYDVLWRGEYGKTFFLQNEKCYDPQNQADWMSHSNTVKGYAAYKVTNNVKHHYAVGMGIYDVFINTNGAEIFLDNAIEVPNAEDVIIENACVVEIANGSGPTVGINHIINGTGAGITTGTNSKTVSGKQGGYALQRLLYYRNGLSVSLPDDYDYDKGTYPIDTETGLIKTETIADVKATTNDTEDAEKTIVKEALTTDNSEILGTNQTTDKYFENKITKYTEEWEKIQAGKKITTTSSPKTEEADVETQIKTKYGVYKGMTYTLGDYTYVVTSANQLTGGTSKLTGVVKSKKTSLKKAVIPATANYNGYNLKVTEVGTKAFKGLKKLQKVTFGKNVKSIGKNAFQNCKKLKKINFKNVKTIGAGAFSGCKALTKVTIGKKVTTIGKNAFKKCKKLKTVVIGKKVKTINAKAFDKDNKIKTINFKGKALKKVKKNAFTKTVKKNIKSETTKLKGNKKAIKVLKKKLKIK